MTQLRDFDPANYLTDDETIAHYLADAAADTDPDAFLQALGDVARARGIGAIAKETGLARTNLYRVLAPGANPSYLTLRRVMDALGVSLTAVSRRKDAAHV
ncbi:MULTISPECIES: addiction module antidote protein [Achromobacter]|uniref:Putative addiction module antidote protein n=1 Tax=Alcaligenes xylosoxydans xylosoxydans TaxID=85698 RepID=A0A0X8P236_ALCXX|nr:MULTISPECIES: addiction module antidote protein [Achromobacter]AMG38473.1 putative addiction module antidote protein [Achromobacter xylosoxidans]